MIVTYMNQKYDCSRAVRVGDRAILILSDGGIVEFVKVKDSVWERFSFDSGDWEIIELTTSLEDRTASLTGTMEEIMTAFNKK